MGTRAVVICTFSACAALALAGCTSSAANRPAYPGQSWTDKVGDSIKSGTSKMTAAVTPSKKPAAPAVEPDSGPTKPTPAMYVTMAEMSERQGNVEQAEAQYLKALALDSNHAGAMLGIAHLEDRRNNFDVAIKQYQKVIKKHPKEASAHNDLGVCYHRAGKLREAAKELETAIEQRPQRRLYHDNLAAVLVEQGKSDEALNHLTLAHGVAVGHYNLGYLLAQKNDQLAALAHFRKALELDSSLTPAQQWIADLSAGGTGATLAGGNTVAPMDRLAARPNTNVGYVAPPGSMPAQPPGMNAPPAAIHPQREATRIVRFPQVTQGSPGGNAMPPMP